MKYKIIICSRHPGVINGFFRQTSQYFDCLSTSECLDDIANHFRVFRPDAYICFCEGVACGSVINQIRSIKNSYEFCSIPIVIIGDDMACNMLEKLPKTAELLIRQPAPAEKIIGSIINLIRSKGGNPAANQNTARQPMHSQTPAPKPVQITPRPINTAAPQNQQAKNPQKPDTPEKPQTIQKPDTDKLRSQEQSQTSQKPETTGQKQEEKKSDTVSKPIPVINHEEKKPVKEKAIPRDPALTEKHVKRTILVIDDDRNILRLVKSALESQFNVTTMLNGDLIDKFFETKSVNLILLDYEMPGENGPSVFRRLRNMPNVKNTPIVFLTGVSERKKIEEVMSLKPQGYVLKPINMERLFAVIYKLI